MFLSCQPRACHSLATSVWVRYALSRGFLTQVTLLVRFQFIGLCVDTLLAMSIATSRTPSTNLRGMCLHTGSCRCCTSVRVVRPCMDSLSSAALTDLSPPIGVRAISNVIAFVAHKAVALFSLVALRCFLSTLVRRSAFAAARAFARTIVGDAI